MRVIVAAAGFGATAAAAAAVPIAAAVEWLPGLCLWPRGEVEPPGGGVVRGYGVRRPPTSRTVANHRRRRRRGRRFSAAAPQFGRTAAVERGGTPVQDRGGAPVHIAARRFILEDFFNVSLLSNFFQFIVYFFHYLIDKNSNQSLFFCL